MFEIKDGFLKGKNKIKVFFSKALIGEFKDKETLNERFLHQVKKGKIFRVKIALKLGADANARDKNNYNAIGLAVERNNIKMVKFLLNKKRLDINSIQGNFRETPLILAASYSYYNIVEFLVKSGADLNAIDFKGRTALMHAASISNTNIVKLLCSYGANIYIKSMGMNAYDWAGYMKLHDNEAKEIRKYLLWLSGEYGDSIDQNIELLDDKSKFKQFWMRK